MRTEKKHLSTKAHNTDTRLCNRGGNPAQTAAIRTIANPAALVTDPLVRLADQSDGGVGTRCSPLPVVFVGIKLPEF